MSEYVNAMLDEHYKEQEPDIGAHIDRCEKGLLRQIDKKAEKYADIYDIDKSYAKIVIYNTLNDFVIDNFAKKGLRSVIEANFRGRER